MIRHVSSFRYTFFNNTMRSVFRMYILFDVPVTHFMIKAFFFFFHSIQLLPLNTIPSSFVAFFENRIFVIAFLHLLYSLYHYKRNSSASTGPLFLKDESEKERKNTFPRKLLVDEASKTRGFEPRPQRDVSEPHYSES